MEIEVSSKQVGFKEFKYTYSTKTRKVKDVLLEIFKEVLEERNQLKIIPIDLVDIYGNTDKKTVIQIKTVDFPLKITFLEELPKKGETETEYSEGIDFLRIMKQKFIEIIDKEVQCSEKKETIEI